MPFCGVDGEGGNDERGIHQYTLLRAGEFLLNTGEPLTAYECLEFLADLPKDRIYVAFAFGYDVSMIIRRLPESRIVALLDKKRRIVKDPVTGGQTGRYWPVDVKEFQIDYTPGKEFRVRRRGKKGTRPHDWTVISDVFSFFQCSFVVALKRFFADNPKYTKTIDAIAAGKEQRHDFGVVVSEYEIEYNRLEILMLEILMEEFRRRCSNLDIHPRKWQGPGLLVNAIFQREGLPSNKENNITPQVKLWANAAYYGGRFEVSTYGPIPGPIYQYDINSAYASYYRYLPCLVHGEWRIIRKLPPGGIYFARVTFKHPPGMQWHTLPVRNPLNGTLLFPREGSGWYWMNEIEVALKHGVEIQFERGYRYIKQCDCTMFDFVYRLYDQRLKVGKTSGEGKVLKVALATVYGKLAQSIGNPPYANPVWAGLVVSHCRAKLIDAVLQVDEGRDVVMVATDGMFCRKPRDLPTTSQLGNWEISTHQDIFIVQSGVYYVPGEKPKTRGTPQSLIVKYEPEFRATWDRWVKQGDVDAEEPMVNIPIDTFVSARVARAWGRPWQTGQWITAHKRVTFNWTTKRCNPRLESGYLVTDPVQGTQWLASAPHKRIIGGELSDPDRQVAREQEAYELGLQWGQEDAPDWGDHLVWDGDME